MLSARLNTIALLAPAALLAVGVGLRLLQRAAARTERLPEELALGAAWVFVVGGLVWLEAYISGATLLGFGEPWTWLAAAHFGAAGFGALTVTALTCRVVSDPRALRVLRALLLVHPVAYLVVAGGISDLPLLDELGASLYAGLFLAQLAAFLGGGAPRMGRGPRAVLLFSLLVPFWTMIPALAWGFGRPLFGIYEMARYHGLVNAIGHVGVGLCAFAWGRPPAHAPLRTPESSP